MQMLSARLRASLSAMNGFPRRELTVKVINDTNELPFHGTTPLIYRVRTARAFQTPRCSINQSRIGTVRNFIATIVHAFPVSHFNSFGFGDNYIFCY